MRRPWMLGLALLGLTACNTTPSGPTYDITGNTAPVVINTTNGSTSPISTAPCGAAANDGNATNAAGAGPAGQDCSTQANGNGASTAGPAAILP